MDIQTVLRSNGLGNDSTEPDRLVNALVNVNNFLCMRQRGVKSVRLYLGCLKGVARPCNFNLPVGQTSYADKMILHTLVQRLEDPTIAKDVMEEYTTNDDLQNPLTLEKTKKLVKAKQNIKRSMVKLSRT